MPSGISQKAQSNYEVIPDSEEERQRVLRRDNECSTSSRFVEVIEISSSDESDCEEIKEYTPKAKKLFHKSSYRNRRVIASSDEDSSAEVIELSDSSVEVTFVKSRRIPSKSLGALEDPPLKAAVDESLIVFDEPRGARTPLRVGKNDLHKTPYRASGATPSTLNPLSTPLAQRPGKPVEKTPRTNTKKARLEAELRRRQEYAEQVFIELNNLIFKQGLPQSTKLNWSKRLLTTAGKAKYHRSRDGVTTTEIELAEKILDCDERIRNTLSHEMCHLATWVIDDKVAEHHGKYFKAWASRVMKIRPDIDVSIKHSYEISYPFEWECQLCSKVYGRFSKSIRPDECRCGACKQGTLIPLFPTKQPATTSKHSRMAATKPQDSPRAVQSTSTVKYNVSSAESDSDVAVKSLTNALMSTSIAH